MAFTDTERLIGDAAKNQVALNPNNTVFDAKRLIGREFRDHNVQQDMKHWPFKVVDVGDKPKIKVEYTCEGLEKTFTPEEISSMVILRTYVLGKDGIMSEDTGRFLLLQKIYSKSLS